MRTFLQTIVAASVVACFSTLALGQTSFQWLTDLESAKRLAGQTNRLVLVHFWAPWCKPCLKLESEVLSRPEIQNSLGTSFVGVKVNTDEAPATAKLYGVQGLPTDVILTPSGRLVARIPSAQGAREYVGQLSQAAEGFKQVNDRVLAEANRANQYVAGLGATANQYANMAGQLAAPVAQAPPAANNAANLAAPVAPPKGYSPNYAAAEANTTPPPTASVPAKVSAYSDDRYADYFRKRQEQVGQAVNNASDQASHAVNNASTQFGAAATAAAGAVGAMTAPPSAPMSAPVASYAPQAYGVAPSMAPAAAAAPAFAGAAVPSQATVSPPVGPPAATQPPVAMAPAVQLPPGSPPLGLDGYCAVQLREQKRWVTGDRRWGAIHRGRTYLFTGPEEQQKFLANPDNYAPVMAGNDPVMALDQGQALPGKREHGVFYENRIFLFADESSLQRFYQNPSRYSAEVVQAMR